MRFTFYLCVQITPYFSSSQGLYVMGFLNSAFVWQWQDKSRTMTVVSWVTSNFFWFSNNKSVLEMSWEEPLKNECLLSKILRWLVASVILGRISRISPEKSNCPGTLQSFLNRTYERIEMVDSQVGNERLAVIILYLQDRVRRNSDTLPSVVTALCLLLLDRCGKQGKNFLNYCILLQ